jgi:hypothetical protein
MIATIVLGVYVTVAQAGLQNSARRASLVHKSSLHHTVTHLHTLALLNKLRAGSQNGNAPDGVPAYYPIPQEDTNAAPSTIYTDSSFVDNPVYFDDDFPDTTSPIYPYNPDESAYANTAPYYSENNINDSMNEDMIEPDPFHETVQERVDQWRSQIAQQSAATRDSPRDGQGRMNLFASVSRGSRALIFFILILRNLHLYELVDMHWKGWTRHFAVVPLVLLLVSHLFGCITTLTTPRPSHAVKKRLKAILNLDKLLELCLALLAAIRLTVWPSRYTPREVYMAQMFHALFFLLQCQTFTRLSWEDGIVAGAPEGSASVGGGKMSGDVNVGLSSGNRDGNDLLNRQKDDPEWYRREPRRAFGQRSL